MVGRRKEKEREGGREGRDGIRGERRRKEGNGERKKQPGTERKNERDRDSPAVLRHRLVHTERPDSFSVKS